MINTMGYGSLWFLAYKVKDLFDFKTVGFIHVSYNDLDVRLQRNY